MELNRQAGSRFNQREQGGDKVIRNMWKRAVGAAQIRYRNPHQTRYMYASMMLTAGEPPMWVAKQMKHAD